LFTFKARSIGISFDFRRRNHSEESLRLNVQRLKQYKSKLVLLPLSAKRKATDPKYEDLKKVGQLKGTVLPIVRPQIHITGVKIADIENKSAFATLRAAQAVARSVGSRKAHALKKAAAEIPK